MQPQTGPQFGYSSEIPMSQFNAGTTMPQSSTPAPAPWGPTSGLPQTQQLPADSGGQPWGQPQTQPVAPIAPGQGSTWGQQQPIASGQGSTWGQQQPQPQPPTLAPMQNQFQGQQLQAASATTPEEVIGRNTRPVTLACRDVGVSVGKEQRRILSGVSCVFPPGTATAILGTSGAGKTTLMNILAGCGLSHDTGDVLVNGHPRQQESFGRIASYVTQEEHLMAFFTPRDAITLSAKLRLPADTNIEETVNKTLVDFGLKKSENVITGMPEGKKGLSGGERKRLAIALEAMVEPSLLLLDEPTSGLDSVTSLQIGRLLAQLARGGKTVAATIHQPSARLLFTFDRILLVSRGGVAYHGPVRDMLDHFRACGHNCPTQENPADFVMDVLSDDAAATAIVQAFTNSQFAMDNSRLIGQVGQDISQGVTTRRFARSTPVQVQLLVRRAFRSLLLNRKFTAGRSMAHAIMAIVVGIIWFDLPNNQTSVQDRLGVIFFSLLFITLLNILPTVLTFPQEKGVFLHENFNNWYSTHAYFASKAIAELPFAIVLPTIFVSIMFFMVKLRDDAGSFFLFLLALIVQALAINSLGLLLGAAVTDPQFAVTTAPGTVIPQTLVCGFLVKWINMPVWLRWTKWLSTFTYTLQAGAIVVFDGVDLHCDDDELPPAAKLLMLQTNITANEICPLTKGKQVLELFDMDVDHGYTYGLCALAGFFVVFRILAFLALRKQANARVQG